jgi:hypothetical protein
MTAITGLRDSLAERRSARTTRRRLERELASFVTPAQRRELEAMMSRYSASETRQIRQILDAQARTRAASASFGGHLTV